MKKVNQILIMSTLFSVFAVSCKKDKKQPEPTTLRNDVPEFYLEKDSKIWGTNAPGIFQLANNQAKIERPTDLDFNPSRNGELWIVNEGTESTGGSTVRIPNVNKSELEFDYRKDQNSWHFMALPSAIAFSENGDWATTSGILDANRKNGSYTGPSLWSGDLTVYAVPSGGNGSHLDMLHGSPYSMGIASEGKNVYWVYDAYNKHICRYDFGTDHGPGNANHDDGVIQRFTNISLKKNGQTPSHMIMSPEKKDLYAVDGGNNRILRVDISSSKRIKSLPIFNETLADHSEWNASYKVILEDKNLKFCGIALSKNRLFIGEYNTGIIICIDTETQNEIARISTGIKGMTGLAIFNNQIYFTSYLENAVYRVDAK